MAYPPQPPIAPGHTAQPPRGDWTPPRPNSRPAVPWLLGILVGVVVGAVGGWSAAKLTQPEAVANNPVASATTPPSAPAAPAAAASTKAVAAGAKTLKLGQTHSFNDGTYTVAVTALAHKRRGGEEGVEVRTCNKGARSFAATPYPWLLSYGNGEQLIDVTVTGGGLLSPAFVERELTTGKCARGWISFEPPPSGSPDGIEYRLDGITSARWEW